MFLTILVTAECIQLGRCQDPRHCAIALALQPHLHTETQYDLGGEELLLRKGAQPPKKIKLPRIARDFIVKFDLEEPVSPIIFKLNIPKRFLRT